MGNTLEQAWQWLVPLVVADSDGKLLPRSRSRARSSGVPTGRTKGAAPLKSLHSPSSPLSSWPGTHLQADSQPDFFAQALANARCSEDDEADWTKPEQRLPAEPHFSDSVELPDFAELPEAELQVSLDDVGCPALVPAPALSTQTPALLATDLLVHPDANQQMQLKGHSVQYLLRRSSRRSIGFTVGMQGLVVTSPQWVSLQETQAALTSKAGWIVDKLHELKQRREQSDASRVQWCDGGQIDFLGQSMGLRLAALPGQRTRPAHRQTDSDGRTCLYLPMVPGTAAIQVRATVKAWMLREARTHFVARLQHFAPIVGVKWQALRLTSARTRWGSANTDGVIRLNWRLMQHVPAVIDYVVVHELAHLHHMDHSPQFWAVVASILPDWQQQRHILKDRPLPPWE